MRSMLFVLLLAAFGVLALFGGSRSLRQARGFRARAQRVTGVLAGIHGDQRDGRTTTYPVLRFRTLDGTEVETTSNVNEEPYYLTRARGSRVEVLYDPADPYRACIDGPSGRGQVKSGYGVMVLGVVFLLAAAGFAALTLT